MATSTAAKIVVQRISVPIVILVMQDGKEFPLHITHEWHRPLEDMAKLVNDLELRVSALET